MAAPGQVARAAACWKPASAQRQAEVGASVLGAVQGGGEGGEREIDGKKEKGKGEERKWGRERQRRKGGAHPPEFKGKSATCWQQLSRKAVTLGQGWATRACPSRFPEKSFNQGLPPDGQSSSTMWRVGVLLFWGECGIPGGEVVEVGLGMVAGKREGPGGPGRAR
ncbi:Hypothetical predicted protein [Marmota monax]|uniref:Uncharacterized protein n=1 Tax=Marmota monax TaxID=9995 RepID=A0A5E4BG77_MARMO|nr:hypothetical protein GHT09_013507 [Marmota monax]VTJ68693.1 Hypothetical predicted protein [Marmota monax]